MKKILHITISLAILFPLYGYAEVQSSEASSVKEVKGIKEVKESKDLSEDSRENIEVKTKEATGTEKVPALNDFTLCSQEAIESRDTRIAASRSIYNTAMANALNERKNKEKTAVATTKEEDKRAAIKTSAENYKSLVKNAQNTLTQSRKTAWAMFEDDLQTCRDLQNKTEEETKTENFDSFSSYEKQGERKSEVEQPTTFKNTLKAGFDSIKSLFSSISNE